MLETWCPSHWPYRNVCPVGDGVQFMSNIEIYVTVRRKQIILTTFHGHEWESWTNTSQPERRLNPYVDSSVIQATAEKLDFGRLVKVVWWYNMTSAKTNMAWNTLRNPYSASHEITGSIAARQVGKHLNLSVCEFHRTCGKFEIYYAHYLYIKFFFPIS